MVSIYKLIKYYTRFLRYTNSGCMSIYGIIIGYGIVDRIALFRRFR